MRTADRGTTFGFANLEATCETMLLGRLGSEIALIYRDALQSPLPPRLQDLIDRLDSAAPASGGSRREFQRDIA